MKNTCPKVNRREFVRLAGLGIFAMGLPGFGKTKSENDLPNIILIMADDMGYSDLGCYGGEIETPHLDRLAEGGMRFHQFYNNAKCGPTRASLLTGQYSQAVGVKDLEHGATFGEILRPAGYRTICSGKWHQSPLPTSRGFDRYTGLADGCCNFWNPGTKARPGEAAPGRKGMTRIRRWAVEDKAIMGYVPEEKDFYTTDVFTDYAIDRLEEYRNEEKPFLLYLAYTAPHYPLHAWPEDIAKYRGKYKKGWDVIRKERHQRMMEMGVLEKGTKLSPRDRQAWETLSEEQKDAADLRMAVYAAMIDRMDQNIGRLMAKVRELGVEENTLVLFLSDNGGCAETPDTTPDIPPGPVESYRALGPAWANATNTPYRKYKSTDYEGGARTPFIAYWPKVIAPGTMTDQVGHIIDVLPTFMEMTGAAYPRELNGRMLKSLNGKSLLPIFQGKKRTGHEVLFWQFGRAKAVRQGKWKLVKYGMQEWELYDVKKDPTELNNLASNNIERANKMASMWEEWFATA